MPSGIFANVAWITDTDVPWRATHEVNLGIELLGQRIDDAGAEATFCVRKHANRCAEAIIDNRKLPIRSSDGESDGYLTVNSVA